MTSDRRPLERAIDLTFFAPIGLAATMATCLPRLVADGRHRVEQRIAAARAIGEVVVTYAGHRVLQRFADDRPSVPPLTLPTALLTTAGEQRPIAGALRRDKPHIADVAELPIDEYESLAASQVVARLESLDAGELSLVEQFERANRRRRTVLGKIEQLRRA
jgi:hypothetical protein